MIEAMQEPRAHPSCHPQVAWPRTCSDGPNDSACSAGLPVKAGPKRAGETATMFHHRRVEIQIRPSQVKSAIGHTRSEQSRTVTSRTSSPVDGWILGTRPRMTTWVARLRTNSAAGRVAHERLTRSDALEEALPSHSTVILGVVRRLSGSRRHSESWFCFRGPEQTVWPTASAPHPNPLPVRTGRGDTGVQAARANSPSPRHLQPSNACARRGEGWGEGQQQIRRWSQAPGEKLTC